MPMKTIFECETEIGRCDNELLKDSDISLATGEFWTIYAHTTASLNGSKRMLKIEQRCYRRRETEVADQPWVRPDMSLEPVTGPESEMIRTIKKIHEAFIERARQQLPDSAVAPVGL